ncbi:hypothetical protein NKG05_11220 [Oerskovia sp. M15]
MLLTSTATAACSGRTATIQLKVTNTDSVPIDVRVTSAAGEHKFSKIPVGSTVEHTLTRGAALDAGEAKLVAYKNVDGAGVQSTSTAAHAAVTCR